MIKVRHYFFPFLLILTCLYFTYHLFRGDRGIIAWRHMQHKICEKRLTLVNLNDTQNQLSQKVALLRPSGLDTDMLEDRAHKSSNLAHPEDYVIYLD